MHDDYYRNILYPLQDKVLNIMANLPVDFYLTGGTALSRAFLHHRYSDDLDFFVNGVTNFKSQVDIVLNALEKPVFIWRQLLLMMDMPVFLFLIRNIL